MRTITCRTCYAQVIDGDMDLHKQWHGERTRRSVHPPGVRPAFEQVRPEFNPRAADPDPAPDVLRSAVARLRDHQDKRLAELGYWLDEVGDHWSPGAQLLPIYGQALEVAQAVVDWPPPAPAIRSAREASKQEQKS